MTEKSNFAESIHNEEYYKPFNIQNITHESMIFMEGRSTEKLNGRWHYVHDLYDVGFRDSWFKKRVKNPEGLRDPWDFHPKDGKEIMLPCCWNTVDPKLFYFEGSVWFSREFEYKKDRGDERVFLRIGAANYDTKIFLNNKFLGNHIGGSTPFFVELTDTIINENELLISVNNSRTGDSVPMKNTDWNNWGGLYRDIELVRVPQVFISEFSVSLVPDGEYNKIEVSCTTSDKVNTQGTLVIPELGINKDIEINEGIANIQINATPDLWEPGNPVLYNVSFRTEDDYVEDMVGFREVKVKGTKVFLNGKDIFLRGISVHEDDADNGKYLSDMDLERRFNHAKELGVNFLRLAHYPHDERVPKMADRKGILLWEEIPVYWAINFDNQKTYNDAENQLVELIKRDRNRASVIIWSVGNENQDTDSRLKFMRNLVLKARSIDSSRMISAACLVNHDENKIEDRLAESLDIIGLNEYFGWYNPDFNELNELVRNSAPDKPVLISELGAGAKAGHHGTKDEMFTEEFMDNVYKQQIATIRSLDYICGMTPWILYDFTCPRRQNIHQQGYNRKGLIAEDKKTKKMAFFTLRDFYYDLASRK